MKRKLYLVIFLFLFSLFSIPMITNATWWDTSWLYREPINITVTTGNKTNFQVNVTINTQSLVSASKMQSSCNDVRFTWFNSTSGSEQNISFWNQTECNSPSTNYWIKPLFLINKTNGGIPGFNNTIYMYYGNPSASAFNYWVPAYNTTTYSSVGISTWTAPTGVTSVKVEVWAAGGGGGATSLSVGGGGGGGGGAYSRTNSTSVTPGTGYFVGVGAGGAGGQATGGSGKSGQQSNFTNSANTTIYCNASGGGGSVGTPAGSRGDSANGVGDFKYSGGTGGAGGSTGGGRWGGGGGGAGDAANGGNGDMEGNGGSGGVNGGGAGGSTSYDGTPPGGGGAGSPDNGNPGNSGAAGQVRVGYINSTNVSVALLSEQTAFPLPYFSANATSTTGAGKPANFTINVTGNASLGSTAGYIFSTNNSGTWVNSSYATFAGTGLTLTAWNVTTLNSTLGALVQWMFYANDTNNYWNSSAIYSLTTIDLTPPYFSANATNTTGAGKPANFTINVTDNVNLNSSAGYIFSTNNSGTWTNSSYAAFAGSVTTLTAWNVTTLNSTLGALVQWMFYANDTNNYWNSSAIYSLTTTDATSPTYSLNGTNSTVAGSAIKHSLYWTDNTGLSGYIFSFYNGTYNGATWWNTSWLYREPINITVTTGNKTNFQVNVTINTQSLVSASKMQSSCNDVRFTWFNSTSGSEQNISFWNQTECNSPSTNYWIKPLFLINKTNGGIPGFNNTIYMYYGNPSASAFNYWVPAYNTTTYSSVGISTWTAPTGVTSVKVEVWAAGGGGGATNLISGGGGGGGGGAYSRTNSTSVTPGTNYFVGVGAGGAGGQTGGGSGNGGQQSNFTNSANTTIYCNASGGGGGGVTTAGSRGDSANGVGDFKYSGGSGGAGGSTGGGRWGGGGGGAGDAANGGNGDMEGNGGSGGVNGGGPGGNTGSGGSQPGGGGGGSTDNYNPGFAGATGQVRVGYINFTNVSVAVLSEQPLLTNDTWVAMTGTGNWSDVAKTITSTVGLTIRWCVYANDTNNNWNGTSCSSPFSYTTTETILAIVSKGIDAYALEMSSDGSTLKGDINNIKITAPVSAPTSWHHYVLTYDGSNQKLYIDGVLANSTSLTGAISTNANNLKIGEYFSGTIDEVKIYNRSLSADEVKADYELGIKKLSSTGRTDLISTSTNVYLVLANPNGNTHFDEVKIKTNKRSMMLSIPYLNVDLNGTARIPKGNYQLPVENKGSNTTVNKPIVEVTIA